MTVKLDPPLERALRERSTALGLSASTVMREALSMCLAQTEAPMPSAYELGAEVFGKYAGPPDLASRRKNHLADVLAEKQATRPLPPTQTGPAKAGRK